MAEMKNAHFVVEIPVTKNTNKKQSLQCKNTLQWKSQIVLAIFYFSSFGKEKKICMVEEHLLKNQESIQLKKKYFQLCCFFLMFHSLFLTMLFTSSLDDTNMCHKWWIPSLVSLCTSLVIAFLLQMKLCRYWKVCGQLQREKTDNRAVTRCIQELRMKGASFDLMKEPQSGKRMKSSSVEIKWKPIAWVSQYLVTICLVSLAGLLFPVSRFMLCY